MSWLWHFYSYSQAAFDNYLGGGHMDAVEAVITAATWDEDAWDDVSAIRHVCSMIARQGINYAELSPPQAEQLDELLPMLFAPEGMKEEWGVTPESPEGLHPSVIRELLPRAEDSSLLPVLLAGRRYGAAEPSECSYGFLAIQECEQLAAEAERALAANGPWSAEWLPGVVTECLIGPLRSAVSKRRPVFGVLG